ncbi:MAG: Uma2 family endonuclease [Verrucomicrobia bacterium]|jgi:Uma2 family endonuclease|nr:Uma2 family endonuclease [Verrucomicrobiota bacterium]|tara:strand:+ start:16223 stop:16792 length:570 start_codon:yes stop_codon:yes gene_type:complete
MELLGTNEIVSVEEYLSGELVAEIKHEYLGGIVHAMTGGKVRHSKAAVNICRFLGNALEGKPCQPFSSDMKVRIELPEQTRFYYPDAMVVCDSLDDDSTYQDKPVVVIEVLSESTKRVDMGEKRDAYRAVSTLRALLLVDPERPYVTVDRRRENGGFDTEFYTDMGEVIPLAEISAELRMDSIYSGMEI